MPQGICFCLHYHLTKQFWVTEWLCGYQACLLRAGLIYRSHFFRYVCSTCLFFPTFTLRKRTPFLHIERCGQNMPQYCLSALSLRATENRERYLQHRFTHNLRRLFACILCLYFIRLPSVWRLTYVIWQSNYSRLEMFHTHQTHWLQLMPAIICLLIRLPCY